MLCCVIYSDSPVTDEQTDGTYREFSLRELHVEVLGEALEGVIHNALDHLLLATAGAPPRARAGEDER
eukprot:2801391-Pyramimonas_sp.AAC.2